jgi:menaquinone-9 beta-reductase
MDTCDVLIVGGGPAGSTCARKLGQEGIDVLLLDKQRFPRPKPCAGWITPAVLAALEVDSGEYRQGRVLQEIRSFRTGIMFGPEVVTDYDRTVSYGVRRCEFDDYLLRRSATRQLLGEAVSLLERKDGWWLVNGHIRAGLVVGAGGHFCPVARVLGAKIGKEPVIAAQVTELELSLEQQKHCRIPADTPALFFSRDLKGYGWLFRKGRFLNVGMGRMDREHLGLHTEEFCRFVEQRGYLPPGLIDKFRGHVYLAYQRRGGRCRGADGALLLGDAAGLCHSQSGEGILPAIESALMAAETILDACGDYRQDNLDPYQVKLAARFNSGSPDIPLFVSRMLRPICAGLFATQWFTRHIVLDRWFLHADQPPLLKVFPH